MQGGRRLEHAIGGWGGWASWPDRYSAGNQSYRELLVAPDHEAVDPARRVRGVERDRARPLEQHREHIARLHTGKGRADAMVNATPERDMPARHVPLKVDFVGPVELSGVAVGGAPEQQHRRSRRDVD